MTSEEKRDRNPFKSQAEFNDFFLEQQPQLLKRARRRIGKGVGTVIPVASRERRHFEAPEVTRQHVSRRVDAAIERAEANLPLGGPEQDIVQEVWVRCVKPVRLSDGTEQPNFKTFRGESTRRTWLTRILDNTIADMWRKQEDEAAALLRRQSPRPKTRTCPFCFQLENLQRDPESKKGGMMCPACGVRFPKDTPADYERYTWRRGLLRAPKIAVWMNRWVASVESPITGEDGEEIGWEIADPASLGAYIPTAYWFTSRWWRRIVIQLRVQVTLARLPLEFQGVIWGVYVHGVPWAILAKRTGLNPHTLQKDTRPYIEDLRRKLREAHDLLPPRTRGPRLRLAA